MKSFIIGLLLGTLLALPVFRDPYGTEDKVNFWTWAFRELDELIHGEKNKDGD